MDPLPDNPAAKAGMLPGDILLAVDGREITPEMTVLAVRDMIRGEKGTAVILTVLHEGEAEPVDLEIVRMIF
ncbi:MAG: PDZ domain-containing protein [Chloroflexi bacterium]|nr:PDZ domain-containing protein [Chloroflexota bacterium]